MKWNEDIIDSIVQAACIVADVAEEEKALRNIKVGRRNPKTNTTISQIQEVLKKYREDDE